MGPQLGKLHKTMANNADNKLGMRLEFERLVKLFHIFLMEDQIQEVVEVVEVKGR